MISEKAKAQINSLSIEELTQEAIADRTSRFQGEKHDYLLARLALLKEEKRTAEHREKVNAAEDANRIAEDANRFSKLAVWVSVFAFLISLFNFLHTVSADN